MRLRGTKGLFCLTLGIWQNLKAASVLLIAAVKQTCEHRVAGGMTLPPGCLACVEDQACIGQQTAGSGVHAQAGLQKRLCSVGSGPDPQRLHHQQDTTQKREVSFDGFARLH